MHTPTSTTSTAPPTGASATSSPQDFPASPSPSPGSDAARLMTATSGLRLYECCEKCSPSGAFLKTLLASSAWSNQIVHLRWKSKRLSYFTRRTERKRYNSSAQSAELSETSLTTLSKRDTYRSGQPMAHQSCLLFRLVPSEPSTAATGYGLLPTPTVNGNNNNSELSPKAGDGLNTAVRRLIPTPTAQDGKNLTCPPSQQGRDSIPGFLISAQPNGSPTIHPNLYRLLMGYPEGWLDDPPKSAPTETPYTPE